MDPTTWSALPTLTPSGSPRTSTTMAATRMNTVRPITFTSVQVTAWTPPRIVYTIAGTQIASAVSVTFQPRITDNTTAGAATITLQDRPRDSRKRRLVSARVFGSKRRSRYS